MDTTAQPRLGKYELQGELGRGAMGVVYRALDTVLCREVALKTMAAPQSNRDQTERFLREARTAGSLHHPNIVTIHELGQESGTYYISMELLRGQTLRQMCDAGQLPPIHRRLEIVARVCDGLDYAHRAGIVHRDVKPANIFLLQSGTVKILDFGIAKIATSNATRTGSLMGTVDYMSPEQVRAVKNLDGRSDIFSAGVILYELLFNRRPFSADDLGAALHRILHQQPPGFTLFDRFLPEGLAEVMRRSLDKRREARFQRAGEMAEALDRVADSLHGRTGTELAERIEEILASGVLDGPATAAPRAEINSECETEQLREDRTPAAATAVRKLLSPNRRPLWLAVGLAIAVVALLVAGRYGENSVVEQEGPRVATAPLENRTSSGDAATDGAAQPADPSRSPIDPEASLSHGDDVPDDPAGELDPVLVADASASAQESATGLPVLNAVVPPPVDAPAPTEPAPAGSLTVLVMPWANIEWIENLESGERVPSDDVTPVRLDLPAGRYRLRLNNPYTTGPLDVDAEVRAGQVSVVRRTLAGFDPGELTREILSRESTKEVKR